MGTLRFTLRTDKIGKSLKCPLELIYQISGQRKKVFIDSKLNAINWDAESQTAIYITPIKAKKIFPQPYKNLDAVILMDSEVEEVNNSISKVKSDINDIEKRFELDKVPYTAQMVIDRFKNNKSEKTQKEEHRDLLFDFMDKYIKDHELTREKGSLGVYRSIKNHLHAYQAETKHKVRFETIDYAFFQRFQNFLIGRTKTNNNGEVSPLLNNTTIAKALSTLKTFLGYARRHGIKVNDSYKDFSIKREKLEVIALNEDEFTALLNIDLSQNKKLDKVRDIFCFSCASGLRVSDLEQLKREHIKNDEINLIVKKTKTELTIPLNKISYSILNKYKDQNKPLPLISSQKLNEYIKDLCELAKINDPIEIVRFRGPKRETIIYPKYKLIHIHTGRKTFVTLSLERGMSAEQVMAITGHTDYKSFKRYVDVSKKLAKVVMVKAWGEVSNLKAV
ncbi:site-specific integrase [Mucilaginibacter sp. L196]|uniref:site-specific integrase n=1 Tax=Mucilaginibacter sp. L196 TaxID=1641870 RepID=UPI00131AAA0D|nr:site-specific integrase [Mucilaginibacter sp. L196]